MSSSIRTRRALLRAAGTGVAALGTSGPIARAFAQAPVEQLRILVGFAPGSAPDVMARAVAAQLGSAYPRGAIVENRTGGNGVIAVNTLKAAPADGSTVLLAPGTNVSVYPYLFAKPPYDPMLDLKPVTEGAESALWLAIGPAVPATVTNVRELIDWMRQNPKLANAGSPGIGSPPHLIQAMLFQQGGVSWEHVAFPGGPPAVAALLGGHIAAVALSEAPLRPHIASGKLRLMATSGARRSAAAPAVGTLVEQGFPNMAIMDWFGFFAPGGASAAVVDALATKLRPVIDQPSLAAGLTETGLIPISGTPAALAARVAADRLFWEPVIRANHIRVDQ